MVDGVGVGENNWQAIEQSASCRAVAKPYTCLATRCNSFLLSSPSGPVRLALSGASESSQYHFEL